MQAEKKRSEAEEDTEKKLAEMEHKKNKVEVSEADVGDSVTEAKAEFDALKENMQNSSARLDSAFWWLDIAGWAAPVGSLGIYFGVFFYYSLPLDPFGYAGLAIVIPMALFLRLLIWYVRLEASGQDISFVQSIKDSFHSLPGGRFRLGFRPTKIDSKVAKLWDHASVLTKAVQNYVPGVRDYYEGQDRVRNEKGFTVTLRNALAEYGLEKSDRVEAYLSRFGPSTGTDTEWIGRAASDLAVIYTIPVSIVRFAYADYVGDGPAKRDNWSAITGTPKIFQAFVDVLVNSGKLPGEYYEKGKGAYGGIEELVRKTDPFSLSSFLENYNIQYYEYAAEKDSLFDAFKTYHMKTTAAIESEIKRLVPPTFEKERRLDTLFAKASSHTGTEESILKLIFYEREAVSDKRERAWAAVKKGNDESQSSDEPQDLPNGADKEPEGALEHFTRVLVDGGLVDVPEDYSHEEATNYIVEVLRIQPDFTLPTGKSEVRQAFSSLRSEKDSLLRTLAANNIPLAEGDRAAFAKLLPVGETLSTLVTSLVNPTTVPDYIIRLFYYDFTAQPRKRDDYFGDLKQDKAKLNALAQELLNRKLVSTVERNEKEKSENAYNLAAYLLTQKEFAKPVIDSIFSDYSRLFEYSKAVLKFQRAQKVCRDDSDAGFAEVLEQVPHPEADFFSNFVHIVGVQLRQFSEIKLEAEGWLEPTALAVATSFLVTTEDVFLADVACRRTAVNSRAVKILYEYSWINEDEQHKSPTDRTPFSVAVQRAIDGSNPRIEYEGDFQRGLASGFLFRKISEIPITRLHRIEDKVSKVLSEVDFEKRLTAHLQALKTFLQSELRSGIIMESLRMQLVTAYAITVPTSADVISGIIEPLLPKVCDELAKKDASYEGLFIDDEATQPKIGKYTRLGVVPYGMSFSTFSQLIKHAYQIATDRFAEGGGMQKHKREDYLANIIRIFPTEAYFKQLEPSTEGKSKTAEEFLSELIEPILLRKFGEVRTAEILASLKTKEEDQVAMRGVLAKLYDTSGALYLISKDEFDGAVSSPSLGQYIRTGRFDADLARSFGKTKLSELATTIFRSAKRSQSEEEIVRKKLANSIEQIGYAIRARLSSGEIENTSKVAFAVLFDIGMILDGL
jgi:hypothetical protein